MSGFRHCPACGFDLQALAAVVEACLAVARYNGQPVEKIVLVKAEPEVAAARPTTILERIREYLETVPPGQAIAACVVAREVGANRNTVQSLLYQMMTAGELKRPERGYYCRPVEK